MFNQWRALLAERVEEAAFVLGSVSGVHGLVVGGSVGRGEAWPMSDIDLLPICSREAAHEVEQRRANLVDLWAASGRAQTLDVGWLAFTEEEAERAISSGVQGAVGRMHERRWFHGIDKAFGGYGTGRQHDLADAFAKWATTVRFDPAVIEARVAEWKRETLNAHEEALQALQSGDSREATVWLRDAASALRFVLTETWGERLGSMGREWTRFERLAQRHEASDIASVIATVAAAEPEVVRNDAEHTPPWLRTRIELALAARLEIGEVVTADENARDQIAAFRVLVVRHRPDLRGDWLRLPDPLLDVRMSQLETLLDEICLKRD